MIATLAVLLGGWAYTFTPGQRYAKTSLNLVQTAFCRQYGCKRGFHFVFSDSTTLEPLDIRSGYDLQLKSPALSGSLNLYQRLDGVLQLNRLTISAPLGSSIQPFTGVLTDWAKLSGIQPSQLLKLCTANKNVFLPVPGTGYEAYCTVSSAGSNALIISAGVELP